MNNKKLRKIEKVRAKPDDEDKLISIKSHKRLIVKKTKEAKNARAVEIILRIFGGVLMAGVVSIWFSKYRVVPMTGLALIGGILLAGIFKLIYPEGLDASNRIHKIIALCFLAVVMLLLINRSTSAYARMLFFGLVPAVYLFGVVKTLSGLKP